MAPTPRAVRRSSPPAELLELRILGLHVMALLTGRSRGWLVRHSPHFALQESGNREAGGGARAPKAAAPAASLAAPPAHTVAALSCPSPHHRPVVRAFSANGAREFGEGGLRRAREQDPIRGPGTPPRRREQAQTLSRRWTLPVGPLKFELPGRTLAGSGPSGLSNAIRP